VLTEGAKLRILVGQSGTDGSSNNGGGGGGSFVMKESDNSTSGIFVIAGGGGGGGYNANGSNVNSLSSNSGQQGYRGDTGSLMGNPTSSGNGGFNYDKSGGGGGGLSGDGGSTTYGSCGAYGGNGGKSFISGGSGATGTFAGGFGGGGSGDWCYWTGGGGGGGYSGGSGGHYYGSGGGGGSFNTGTNQVNTAGTNASSGYVTITSLGPELVQFSSSPSITNAATLSYTVNFGQSVTGLTSSDFSISGTGASGCTVDSPSGSGTNYTLTVSGCSQGTVILTLATNSVANGSAQSGPTSNNVAQSVLVDRTAPTISAAVTGPSNATYIPGQSLTFTAPFSETVTVTGTPRLALTIGSTTRFANYASGSNSRTLTFTYVVQTSSGDIDTDGIAVSTTLDLNGGAIADLASNALSPEPFTAPTLTSVLVAQTPAAPTITSITPSSGSLSVAFTAGATNGSAITNYEFSTNNGANWTVRSPTATTSPISISGLTNGTAYNVRIRAVNAAGAGDSSTAVSATPSAVVVSGDATLTSTYGQAASTGTYTSSGGTGPYTYTLSASATGVTITSGVVTASASTPAGTYVRNVVSTDSAGTPQSGTKQLTITINKASTTITISLPGSATDAALGGAITITAAVSQAGSVNFKLGGSTISGCGTVASSAGSATCSWTPGALGEASLTAVLTPTDSSNYESATTSTLSITVVNGVTSLALSLAGGVTQAPKGQNIVITATVDQAGRISFFVDGKRIAGCFNKAVSTSSKTCTWKPSVQKQVTISSRLVPTNSAYSTATESMKVWVVRRTGTR
jgi:hypothetical protein